MARKKPYSFEKMYLCRSVTTRRWLNAAKRNKPNGSGREKDEKG